MSMRLRFLTVVSVTTMLAVPALASAQSPTTGPAPSEGDVCIYFQGPTDTPQVGPLPCDTSRSYMIGHSGLGSRRIPDNSEFNVGPKSHLDEGTSGTTSNAPTESEDGAGSAGDGSSHRSIDTEAP